MYQIDFSGPVKEMHHHWYYSSPVMGLRIPKPIIYIKCLPEVSLQVGIVGEQGVFGVLESCSNAKALVDVWVCPSNQGVYRWSCPR